MKKRILAVAILSTLTTLAHADDFSFVQGTTTGSTIDMYQVPYALDSAGVADPTAAIVNDGSDALTLSSGTGTQMNIMTGTETGGQNTLTVDQSGATTSIANVALNAQVIDGSAVLNDVGAGNYVTGQIADLTAAIDGIKGQQTAADTTLNTITLTQSGTSDIAAIAVAGTSNTVTLSQSGLLDKSMILVDGSNNTVTVAQANDNAVYNLALHASNETITVNQ